MDSRVRIGLTLIVCGVACIFLVLGVTALGIYLQYAARNEINPYGQPRFEMPGWALVILLFVAGASAAAVVSGVQIGLRRGKGDVSSQP